MLEKNSSSLFSLRRDLSCMLCSAISFPYSTFDAKMNRGRYDHPRKPINGHDTSSLRTACRLYLPSRALRRRRTSRSSFLKSYSFRQCRCVFPIQMLTTTFEIGNGIFSTWLQLAGCRTITAMTDLRLFNILGFGWEIYFCT